MLCLGRWDDLGAGGRATRMAGCLLTFRVACWLPKWPVGYQSGLLATRVACWLPEWGLAGLGGAGLESGHGAVVLWGQQPTMGMMMEWALDMMNRMQESDGKIVKKKRRLDGVDDNEGEEEMVAVSFNIVGEDDGQMRVCWVWDWADPLGWRLGSSLGFELGQLP